MESVTRLFLLRPPSARAPRRASGSRAADSAGQLAGAAEDPPAEEPIDGDLDFGLDDAALLELAPLCERLAARAPAVLVSSPSERAVRVLRALADRTSARTAVERDLRPRSLGAWQGTLPSSLGPQWGRFLADRAQASHDAEPLAAAEARVLAVLDRLASDFPRQEVVVVLHADGIRAALARALRAPQAAAFAPEPGQAVALDWAHPQAREFHHALVGMAFDWQVAPAATRVQRYPGGASVLPRTS